MRPYNIDPEVAHQRAKIAANARWSREADRVKATAPMRDARREQWADEVDPDRTLDPAVLEKLVEAKLREHLARMNLARALKRARREAGEQEQAQTSGDVA